MSTCSWSDPPPPLQVPLAPLYNYVLSPTGQNFTFTVPAVTAFLFPFWLCPGASLDLVGIHSGQGTQDFSIRMWISTQILGTPPDVIPNYLKTWEPTRMIPRVVTVHDAAIPSPPSARLPVALPPGPYIVNAFNLTNFVNEFSLRVVPSAV